jgi:uncharacterized delta-60 repeat protein
VTKKLLFPVILLTGWLIYFFKPTYSLSSSEWVNQKFSQNFIMNSDIQKDDILWFGSQSDGKILVGTSSDAGSHLRRLNPDGSVDKSFTIFTNDTYFPAFFMQPDDKILINLYPTSKKPMSKLLRLNANGTIDNTFSASDQNFKTHVLQVGNKILNSDLTQLNSDGSKDEKFNIGTGLNANAYCLETLIQHDDKTLLGGSNFATFNGLGIPSLIRLNVDGSVDKLFFDKIGKNLEVTNINSCPVFTNLAEQTDEKILVLGEFNTFQNVQTNGLFRLNPDGTFDDKFHFIPPMKLSFDKGIQGSALIVQKDGKILVFGLGLSSNGNPGVTQLALRLNSDGSLDKDLSGAIKSTIQKAILQKDGTLLISAFDDDEGKVGLYKVKLPN